MRRISFLILAFLVTQVSAQEISFNSEPEGFWTGSFIKNGNSSQAFEVEFYQEKDSVFANFRIPDWTYYSSLKSTLEREGRVVKFDSFYGKMTLVLDSNYAEMLGECNFARVHMKKALRPPRIPVETTDLNFKINNIQMAVQIMKPVGKGPFPTAILVHGRGCGSKDEWDQRPRILSQYGIAVVSYDKRGSESTGFPCEETTMDLNSADLARLTEKLAQLSYVGQLGYIAYSAGGWVAPKAAAESKEDVDFIVSIVGPSTSVRQQQLDCCEYYLRDGLGLSELAVAQAKEYTELEFVESNHEATYSKMMALLDSAETNSWLDVLDEDDIPTSAETLDKLWVRRNIYDPKNDLQSFQGPFLSILGGDDYVVPYRENLAGFKNTFDAVGKSNYRVITIPGANHGMEHGHESRDLGYEPSIQKWYTYFKFDRVAAGSMDEIIRFLRDYEIITY